MIANTASPDFGSIVRPALCLWTPEQGVSGLIVVARQRPLLAVIGSRVLEMEPGRRAHREGRQTVTLGGLVIISASRHAEPKRVIGHPDLASGTSVQRGSTLYVSVSEAIYRQREGAEVEIHLAPTAEDEMALADFRTRARQRWEGDRLPDGWTRPLPPPKPREKPVTEPGDDELTDELRALAEQIRAKDTKETR